MKITKFDKPAVMVLREKLDAEFEALSKKYGLKMKLGNATYDQMFVHFKLTVSVIGEDGRAATPERVDLERFYPDMVDKTIVTHRGVSYKVVGVRARARKNRWCIERVPDGKRFLGDDRLVGYDPLASYKAKERAKEEVST